MNAQLNVLFFRFLEPGVWIQMNMKKVRVLGHRIPILLDLKSFMFAKYVVQYSLKKNKAKVGVRHL